MILIKQPKPGRQIIGFILCVFLLFPIFLSGQNTGDVDPSMKSHQENLSPVRVDGEVLFYVRGVMSYPAEIRAATIRQRIYKAAENYSISPDSTRFIPDGDKMKIYVGTEFIMNVYSVDAEADGISKELQAEVIVQKNQGRT